MSSLSFLSHLTVTGDVGTDCIVHYVDQGSTNWQTLTNFTLASDSFSFIDTSSSDTSKRSYAITVAPPKPTQVIMEPTSPFVYHGLSGDAIWASSFTSGPDTWQISSMYVGIYYLGLYSINFHLYEDENGLPGTEIYTVENTYDVTFPFAEHEVVLLPNTKYWVGVERNTGTSMAGYGIALSYSDSSSRLTTSNGFEVSPGLVYRRSGAWTVDSSQVNFTLDFKLFVLPE
jgi:hypothetical protein